MDPYVCHVIIEHYMLRTVPGKKKMISCILVAKPISHRMRYHSQSELPTPLDKGPFRSLHSPGPWFNIKMSSYQYRKSHCGDKTILRPSYLHNGISYTGKMSSLYWIGALATADFPVIRVVQGTVSGLWKMFGNFTIHFIYSEASAF